MQETIDALVALGFTDADPAVFQAVSDGLGLSHNGAHIVHAYLTKGDVTAVIEQNVSPDTNAGVETIVKHPPVLILESPKGRVAVTTIHDTGLIEALVADLS